MSVHRDWIAVLLDRITVKNYPCIVSYISSAWTETIGRLENIGDDEPPPPPDGDSAERERSKNRQDYLYINQHHMKNGRANL